MSIADGVRKGGMIGCRESQGQMSARVVGDIGDWMAIVASPGASFPTALVGHRLRDKGVLSTTMVGGMNKLSGWFPLAPKTRRS